MMKHAPGHIDPRTFLARERTKNNLVKTLAAALHLDTCTFYSPFVKLHSPFEESFAEKMSTNIFAGHRDSACHLHRVM